MHDRDSRTVQAWVVFRYLLALGVGMVPSLGWAEEPAAVPEHSFLQYAGNSWACEQGFQRSGDRCAPE